MRGDRFISLTVAVRDLSGRMASNNCLFATYRQRQRPIHVQCCNGCSARCARALNLIAHPSKMIMPFVSSGIIERNFLAELRINGTLACSLPKRTRYAGNCEILVNCLPICGFGKNVIEVKCGLLSILRQAAVLTSRASAVDDQPAQLSADIPHVSQPLTLRRAAHACGAKKAYQPD